MSTSVAPKDHYNNMEVSREYHSRPGYSSAIFETIKNFLVQHDCRPHFAVDVACGTGHSSLPLADFCEKVLAFDISETQLAVRTGSAPNVEFRQGDAHAMTSFIEPGSVDLVTIATSLHWLDQDTFFSQVDSVLKPGGVLVVYNYDYPGKFSLPEAKRANEDLHDEINAAFKGDCALEALLKHSKNLKLPYPDWQRYNYSNLVQRAYTVPQCIGYLRSNSYIYQFDKLYPEKAILEKFAQRAEQALAHERALNPDFDGKLHVEWDVFMLVGQKPRVHTKTVNC